MTTPETLDPMTGDEFTSLEKMARVMCRNAGLDPDHNVPEEYSWVEFIPEAREALDALRDFEAPGLLSLSMSEVVDAILNENKKAPR